VNDFLFAFSLSQRDFLKSCAGSGALLRFKVWSDENITQIGRRR